MAVVTKYGTGARDPGGTLRQIDGIFAAAELRALISQITITNGDSANSIYYLGEVPADAILDPDASYDYQAITSVASIDVGFYQPLGKGGAVIAGANLIAADDVTAAGAQTLKGHGTLTTANGHKRVWELAGLSVNPGGNIAIGAKINNAATATGVINWRMKYFKGA